MKFLPRVAETFDITDVLSLSIMWYLGSAMSPMNRRMVTQSANAACFQKKRKEYIYQHEYNLLIELMI